MEYKRPNEVNWALTFKLSFSNSSLLFVERSSLIRFSLCSSCVSNSCSNSLEPCWNSSNSSRSSSFLKHNKYKRLYKLGNRRLLEEQPTLTLFPPGTFYPSNTPVHLVLFGTAYVPVIPSSWSPTHYTTPICRTAHSIRHGSGGNLLRKHRLKAIRWNRTTRVSWNRLMNQSTLEPSNRCVEWAKRAERRER